MAQVFLSHSQKDRKLAEQLAEGLETAGYSVWYCERDNSAGPHYLAQELPAIRNSEAVVVLISPHSITSREVSAEVYEAHGCGKHVIPVLHGMSWEKFKTDPPDWKMAVSGASGMEIKKGDTLSAATRVVEALKKWGVLPGAVTSKLAAKLRETSPRKNAKTLFNPEGTVSNPRYNKDVRSLHPPDNLASVINAETVFLVVGARPAAELLDRPLAEILRDQIDRKGGKYPFRRGIVITDQAWYAEEELLGANPVIGVGHPVVNSLIEEFDGWTPQESGEGRYPIQGADQATGFFRMNENEVPQVGLWGDTADGTREAVQHYIKDPAGLASFLKMCWK